MSLARAIKGGEVIELIGDLGAGKTTFVRAFTVALGSEDEVTSPTYSLMNQYTAGSYTINHFDLYRLDALGDVAHELKESINSNSITFIEWAKEIDEIEVIKISIDPTDEEDKRNISIIVPSKYQYLIKELKA